MQKVTKYLENAAVLAAKPRFSRFLWANRKKFARFPGFLRRFAGLFLEFSREFLEFRGLFPENCVFLIENAGFAENINFLLSFSNNCSLSLSFSRVSCRTSSFFLQSVSLFRSFSAISSFSRFSFSIKLSLFCRLFYKNYKKPRKSQ